VRIYWSVGSGLLSRINLYRYISSFFCVRVYVIYMDHSSVYPSTDKMRLYNLFVQNLYTRNIMLREMFNTSTHLPLNFSVFFAIDNHYNGGWVRIILINSMYHRRTQYFTMEGDRMEWIRSFLKGDWAMACGGRKQKQSPGRRSAGRSPQKLKQNVKLVYNF